MKIHLFLLVLNFIQSCFSLHTNLTNNDEYPSCPISAFRSKRALTEYTRWRATQVTKQEFIVKVDDDIINPNTAPPKQILAINVLPVTKAAEKIIINAAINPTMRVVGPTTDVPLEYTRFVPPTTVRLTQVDGDLYLAPVKSQGMQVIKGLSRNRPSFPESAPKHPDRDDSPPASPQFISRTPGLVARQYAPITPVAFFPRSGLPPLTPSAVDEHMPRRTSVHISRTPILPDIETPTRTESTNSVLDIFQPVVEDVNALDSLFTSLENEDKKSEDSQGIDSEPDPGQPKAAFKISQPTRSEWNEVDEGLVKKEMPTTSPDAAYHMMYYNEEDNDSSTTKKADQDSYGRRGNNGEDSYLLKNDSEEELKRTEGIDSDSYVEHVTNVGFSNSKKDNVENSFNENNTTNKTTDTDIEEESVPPESLRGKRRPACNLLKLRELSFSSPRTLPEIVAQLKRWTDDSPIAKWIDITDDNYTTMENPIYMMIIDDPSSGQIVTAKQTVLIVAGIQGRDHHAVAAALYVLHQLIERSDAHTDLLAKYRFWIIPVFNPDGYDYSMTFPQRREWTKNLHQSWESCKGRDSCSACETYGLRCTVQPCYGVNLDRNFEYQWIPPEELRAEHPCGDLYAGTRQLSEHETRALTRYLHEQRTPLHTFIVFKEGDVLGVMYPYSHTKKRRAYDSLYRQRASRAAAAAYSISGRPYVAGQTSEFLPLYAGGIEDWVDGHLGIDNTYTIMMFRPSDSYNVNLITERVVHEAYAAMDTLLLQSIESNHHQRLKQVRSAGCARAGHAFLVLAVLAISS